MDHPDRARETEGLRFVIELREKSPAVHPGGSAFGIDLNAAHPREIDDDAAVRIAERAQQLLLLDTEALLLVDDHETELLRDDVP